MQLSEDLEVIKKIENYSRNHKNATFLQVVNKPIYYKFFKDFSNYSKKTSRVVVLAADLPPNIIKYRDHQ